MSDYNWERLKALGYSEEVVNELNSMVMAPVIKKEPAKSKPLMGQSDKRVKSAAVIQ